MPAPLTVSGQPAGSASTAGRYRVNLTGPGSHVLVREAGRGNLVIGPASLGKKAHLHVGPNERIDWSAFDAFATPAGSLWPRHIDYDGNDEGFLAWSQQRGIEQMAWAPHVVNAHHVDASAAKIAMLQLRLDHVSGHLGITLPDTMLALYGDLSRVTVEGKVPGTLLLHPALGRRPSAPPGLLPDLGMLHGARALYLYGNPQGQPLSLQGIDRFTGLERLMLWGSFADWHALAALPLLTNLEIRYCPDLDGLPALETWPALDGFIAFNVDDAAGKRLKAQVKARATRQPWGAHTSVTQLRKAAWWHTAYGRPFAGWPSRQAKAANAAYDAAQAALDTAATAADVQAAIRAFASHFNTLKGIETTEREDIAEAVWQFSQLPQVISLGVTPDAAQQWFDTVRAY